MRRGLLLLLGVGLALGAVAVVGGRGSGPSVRAPYAADNFEPGRFSFSPQPELAKNRTVPESSAPTSGELVLPVVKLREGDSSESLVSNGIPFAPGQLASEQDVALFLGATELPVAAKVLARWPQDGSIRSLLLQFRLDIDQAREPIIMKWGQRRTTPALPVTDVTWELPEGFLMLPARWLCDSQVIGEQSPMYDHAFPAYDDRIKQYYPARRDDALTGDVGRDDYYSTAHVFYQLYVRSGDPDFFISARKEALRYRDQGIVRAAPKTRYVYVEAMADDYLLTGDARSLAAAKEMAEYLKQAFDPSKAFYPKDASNFWTEREAAFPFLGAVSYYAISGDPDYRQLADRYMEQLVRLQRQWPDRGGFIHNLYAHDTEEGARPDEYGGSPFMTGLLLEPIIEYHRLTGSEQAAQSIFMALDWLMREALAPSGDTFLYLTSDAARAEGEEHPDLNFLLVHAFGYGYRLSGGARTDYLELGRKLLERGIRDANLKDRKHFNQNFRSSGHFLAYVADNFDPGRFYFSQNPASGKIELSRSRQPSQPLSEPGTETLVHDAFDYALGPWGSPLRDAALERDGSTAMAGAGALRIGSAAASSRLTVARGVPSWDLREYAQVRFSYRIPKGLPVGVWCQTSFGDWVALAPPLIDDDQWHEVTLDVASAMRQVLPGVQMLNAVQFASPQDVGTGKGFWIDEFAVIR